MTGGRMVARLARRVDLRGCASPDASSRVDPCTRAKLRKRVSSRRDEAETGRWRPQARARKGRRACLGNVTGPAPSTSPAARMAGRAGSSQPWTPGDSASIGHVGELDDDRTDHAAPARIRPSSITIIPRDRLHSGSTGARRGWRGRTREPPASGPGRRPGDGIDDAGDGPPLRRAPGRVRGDDKPTPASPAGSTRRRPAAPGTPTGPRSPAPPPRSPTPCRA